MLIALEKTIPQPIWLSSAGLHLTCCSKNPPTRRAFADVRYGQIWIPRTGNICFSARVLRMSCSAIALHISPSDKANYIPSSCFYIHIFMSSRVAKSPPGSPSRPHPATAAAPRKPQLPTHRRPHPRRPRTQAPNPQLPCPQPRAHPPSPGNPPRMTKYPQQQ